MVSAKMKDKRSVDMQVIGDWVEPGSRVLDLGCGRGVLLDYLKQKLGVKGVGVDLDLGKGKSCLKRGVNIYIGDMMDFMKSFPDKHFDYVICSRTVQELNDPHAVIREALRVSKHLLVGFVNFGYWRNRMSMLLEGHRIRNDVFPARWWESRPTNPLSVSQFEAFCRHSGIEVRRRICLRGDWHHEARRFPNWFCGYAIFDLCEGAETKALPVTAAVDGE